jgi:hypothetical protein
MLHKLTNAKVILLKYDVANDELIKSDDGFCIEAEDETPGTACSIYLT